MYEKSSLEYMIGPNERVFWFGKPEKKCFILESIFNPLLPFAAIWAIFDFGVIGGAFHDGGASGSGVGFFIIPFMLLHLMPVWVYLGGVFFSFRKYRNTDYMITDKGVYVAGGVFSLHTEMKPFTEISHISIHRGIFDQQLGVGDVVISCSTPSVSSNGYSFNFSKQRNTANFNMTIADISDYQETFNLVKKLQTDIFSDTMYPNDLRPPENHGYNTKYTPNDWNR